uniref:Apolipoprotein M n=1 Tax=Buteo japonicus TaxID=224669 RepID=A0A8C0HP79_9AVES
AGQAMLASLALLVGLPLALAAEDPSCTPLVPVTFDNTTIPGILGKWVYITGGSKYPPHVAEMKVVKYAVFSFFPGSHEDELDVIESMRVNETCVVRNTSKIQIFQRNSTLMHVDDQVVSTAELIQSDKDLLILKHFNANFPGLSLSARTPNVSKEHLEEFSAHMRCLGFTEEEVFFTSEKVRTPPQGGRAPARPATAGTSRPPVAGL